MQAANFPEKSYWMTTRNYSPGEPLQEDIDVDVAIAKRLYHLQCSSVRKTT